MKRNKQEAKMVKKWILDSVRLTVFFPENNYTISGETHDFQPGRITKTH